MLGVAAIKWPDIVRVKHKKVLLQCRPSFVGIFVVYPGRAIGDSLKQLTGESNGHQSLGKTSSMGGMDEGEGLASVNLEIP